MQNIKYKIYQIIFAGILIFMGLSCKKEDDELSFERMFRPTNIKSVNGETVVSLSWNPSLFTTEGNVSYIIEISKDSVDFNQPIIQDTIQESTIIYTDQQLPIKTDFYARVKAIGTGVISDSEWEGSGRFRIRGEQFLLPVPKQDIIDVGVIFHWRVAPDLTKIILTPSGGGTPIEVTLTQTESEGGVKQVNNLAQNTTYSVSIFKGDLEKGTISIKTLPSIFGNLIRLDNIIGKPSILIDTLPDIPSGSVVVLKRGESYDLIASYSFSKSVSIVSGLDFVGGPATIRLSNNFNILAASVIDSLIFKEVIFKGARASNGSYNSDYILNVNTSSSVGKIKLDNCIIKILRGTVRLQAGGAGAKVENYIVNNCVLDSIREYGIATASASSAFANIKITNTTMFKARRFIDHRVAGTNSLVIENCTFNEMPTGGPVTVPVNYVIDYNTFNVATPIVIKNCIFGKTWNEGTGDEVFGIRAGTGTSSNVENSYNTSDYIANATKPLGTSLYSGSSTALFTDPTKGNFIIKDSGFAGKNTAGDPRWKK